jgi:sulfur-oxidizing protein SoxB
MVRVGGIQYTVEPNKTIGKRITNMMLNGKRVDPAKTYKVAGWAPVGEGVQGAPIWDVVAEYLRDIKTVKPVKLNQPKVVGMGNNPGMVL